LANNVISLAGLYTYDFTLFTDYFSVVKFLSHGLYYYRSARLGWQYSRFEGQDLCWC